MQHRSINLEGRDHFADIWVLWIILKSYTWKKGCECAQWTEMASRQDPTTGFCKHDDEHLGISQLAEYLFLRSRPGAAGETKSRK
jgi:hypothetical protein